MVVIYIPREKWVAIVSPIMVAIKLGGAITGQYMVTATHMVQTVKTSTVSNNRAIHGSLKDKITNW